MPLDYDTSRAPIRLSDYEALVEAVLTTDPKNESTWLEWKSGLDLSSASGKAHVARAILGFANRMPDPASTYCEGRAYIVVGASPDEGLQGHAELDPAVLDDYLKPYLGGHGPVWAPHWVTREGRQVLVIEVAAPRWGDPIFMARRGSERFHDGAIFVRRPGKTEFATSAELDALKRREDGGRASAERRLEGIEVEVVGGVGLIDVSEASIDAWIVAERERWLSSLPKSESGRSAAAENEAYAKLIRETQEAVRKASEHFVEPDRRTPEEYREEVESYLRSARAEIAEIALSRADTHVTPAHVIARNTTDRYFPSVEVMLHVPGAVMGLTPRKPEANERIPSGAPRPYGPKKGFTLDQNYSRLLPAFSMPQVQPIDFNVPTIENRGSVRITTPAATLRPYGSAEWPVVLVSPATVDGDVSAEWSVTSSLDGMLSGSASIAVGETWNIVELMKDPPANSDD